MKRVICITLMICFCNVTLFAQSAAGFFSYHKGKRYEFAITSAMLADTPAWSENEENPPLSARKAIESASLQLSKLFADSDKWRFTRLSLHKIGNENKWVYTAEFTPPCPNADCLTSIFQLVVLMNGTTVEPKITTDEQSQQIQ